MDELDAVIGDIEASHAMERQERLKLQERLAALTKIGDLDRGRIAALEEELAEWEARSTKFDRIEALSPGKGGGDDKETTMAQTAGDDTDLDRAASKLQAANRGRAMRKEKAEQDGAAAKLQAIKRGSKVRRNKKKTPKSALDADDRSRVESFVRDAIRASFRDVATKQD